MMAAKRPPDENEAAEGAALVAANGVALLSDADLLADAGVAVVLQGLQPENRAGEAVEVCVEFFGSHAGPTRSDAQYSRRLAIR